MTLTRMVLLLWNCPLNRIEIKIINQTPLEINEEIDEAINNIVKYYNASPIRFLYIKSEGSSIRPHVNKYSTNNITMLLYGL